MSTLTRVQGDFQDYLLRGAAAVQQHVIGSARVPVATRLAIYGGAYGSRLVEALENNFPALAKLLGETDFRTLAADYIQHARLAVLLHPLLRRCAAAVSRYRTKTTSPPRCWRSWRAGSGR